MKYSLLNVFDDTEILAHIVVQYCIENWMLKVVQFVGAWWACIIELVFVLSTTLAKQSDIYKETDVNMKLVNLSLFQYLLI